jgi:predicted 3-demethylubiquinone-9 3-methyltransferase (glyoxalase superfamily)
MQKITPFLWFDGNLEEAVNFYTSVFPNARVESINPMTAVFVIEGQEFMALNGGPQFKFNEAVSFFIRCETQAEIDMFWQRLTADGGVESQCGWLKDKFGLSWQVVPNVLGQYLGGPDRARAQRAMQAMLKMTKIDIAALEAAYLS